ncbi:MAG: LacI family DNA-binding transcriptional regulator [Rhizobiaceae bacterium]|nr:MAG: LacI family DNA-binding transcriptional regulator [Rhizobiaceae bacterium]
MDKPRKAFASAKQVAELAGVSRSAVSRTFTPGASVSEETRKRVISASDKLGYHVNHLARGLLRQSSGIVCLVAADSDAPYTSRLIRTLVHSLQQAGKVAMVLESSGPSESADHALRQTLNYRADATVVLSGTPPQSLIRTCLDNGQRLILINRADQFSGPHNISLDSRGAGRTAFRTLQDAGCRRFALVSSEAGTPSLMARERAFVECAEEQGTEVAVTRNGRTSYEAGVLGARRLFSAGDPPDGVFCITDLIACGFMDAARHEFGLAIPEQLSVIGFDDIEQAGWASYRLTTFSPDVVALAARVVELATKAGETEENHRDLIEVPLVMRDTVRQS